jgi:tripartite-type tricarboxylate transporter receptor subunit TctC
MVDRMHALGLDPGDADSAAPAQAHRHGHRALDRRGQVGQHQARMSGMRRSTPSLTRALAIAAAAAATAFAAMTTVCRGANFPAKPITLIVPFAPGASADGIARVVGRELSQELGQPVIVDNKPGAGGALGLIAVAKSQPDGYTIGLGATGALAVNPHLPDAPPLKPETDLVPVGKLADIPLVFVTSASGGYGNLQAFLSAARKQGGGSLVRHRGSVHGAASVRRTAGQHGGRSADCPCRTAAAAGRQ